MTTSRRRGAAGVLTVALLVALDACSTGGSTANPVPVVAADEVDLIGPWTDSATGAVLPDGTDGVLVLSVGAGSTTCDTDGTAFLELAWPVGRRLDYTQPHDPGDILDFVRDTTGSAMEVTTPSDLDTAVPSTARRTGFVRGGNTLSVDAARRAVYVTRASGVTERWARLAPGQGCA